MNQLTPNQREAVRLLGVYTAGRFDPWALMGDARGSCRAHIMAALKGLPKFPKAKSGVNAIIAEFSTFTGAWHGRHIAEVCRALEGGAQCNS